jgi:hypothetical protein
MQLNIFSSVEYYEILIFANYCKEPELRSRYSNWLLAGRPACPSSVTLPVSYPTHIAHQENVGLYIHAPIRLDNVALS